MDPKTRKRQEHRLRATRMTLVSSALQCLLVVLFAATGCMALPAAAAFCALSLGSTGLFTLAVGRGWNLRYRDSWLLHAQTLCNFAIQVVFIAAAPRLWIVFLASTLVSFNYAMLGFTPRQFRWTWAGFGASTAGAVALAWPRLAWPPLTPATVALIWLFFFLAMRRLGLVGMQFASLRAQLSERNRELTASVTRIQELASHDELTGVHNRRRFIQLVAEESERSARTGQPYSVALFDIDHFKSINDRHGHATGDQVLRDFCALVAGHLRAVDRFARYGGEEFVLLMPVTTTLAQAQPAAERIRAAVAGHDWQSTSPRLAGHRVTVSAGIATCRRGES
ncbi:MAG TPA: GGDEF domain-containing protein, partial [Burkholderiaceae bacterium]